MKRRTAWLFAFVASLGSSVPALGFGTKRAHQELARRAIATADASDEVSRYLQEDLGQKRGLDEPLALQFGLDPLTDEDLIVGDDPTTFDRIETRLNRSLSRLDEDDNGRADRPLAPEDTRVYFKENCRAASDFEACFAALPRADARTLIRIGTYAEDNPNPRSRHHFHDPERSRPIVGHGLDNASALTQSVLGTLAIEGVTAFGRGGSWLRAIAGVLFYPLRPSFLDLGNFDLRGRSAADRALNRANGIEPASDAHPDNRFALPDAERYLFLALTSPREDEREHYLALHFLAVGHVLHLLQDMGSVAHVRNDFVFDHVVVDHVLNKMSLESAGDALRIVPAILSAVAANGLASLPYEHLSNHGSGTAPLSFFQSAQAPLDLTGFDVIDFWDRGAFDDPDDLDPARAGLAERVHNRFFSAGSLANFALGLPEYALPRALDCGAFGAQLGSGPDAVRVDELPERSLYTGAPRGTTGPFLASPLVPHLARCRYHALYADGPYDWTHSVLDESVQRDYLELLFPLVIEYTAKFLQFYLAPRLEVIPIGGNEFRLRNLTMLPLRIDGSAVEIAYTAADPASPQGTQRRAEADCGGGELVLPAAGEVGGAGPVGAFTCSLPAVLAEPALDRADFWVIARGTLGQRGAVGTPGEFDAGQKEYVVAFDHVQPRILYHASVEQEEAADLDRRHPYDIYSIPARLGNPLAPDEVHASGTNLTARLRAEIGSDVLDLVVPTGEPGGPRILLRSDRDATRQSTVNPTVGAPERLFLFDPTADPAEPGALVALPSSELEGVLNFEGEEGAWSQDGAAIFHFEDETQFSANRLRRFDLASSQTLLFRSGEAVASSRDPAETPDDLPIGTERQLCSGIDHLDARSGDELLVTTPCQRQVIVGVPGGRAWESIPPVHREVRLAIVEPSASDPGQLEARFTGRFDIASGSVVECGFANTCWQFSSEPAGEPGYNQGQGVWSRDGTKVAFLRYPNDGLHFRQEVWVADLGAGTLRKVMNRDHGFLSDLEWSPDERWIAFWMHTGTEQDLFSIPADAEEPATPQRLTRGLAPPSFSIHAPFLLPDGS